jgi:hypothetical protein
MCVVVCEILSVSALWLRNVDLPHQQIVKGWHVS